MSSHIQRWPKPQTSSSSLSMTLVSETLVALATQRCVRPMLTVSPARGRSCHSIWLLRPCVPQAGLLSRLGITLWGAVSHFYPRQVLVIGYCRCLLGVWGRVGWIQCREGWGSYARISNWWKSHLLLTVLQCDCWMMWPFWLPHVSEV